MFDYVQQSLAGEDAWQVAAAAGTYLLVLLLVTAVLILGWRRRWRKNLVVRMARRTPDHIARLARRDLLLLTYHYLEHKGFAVKTSRESGKTVGCVAEKGGETYYIRCLQGGRPATSEEVLRLAERVRADGVKGGMLVAASGFDEEAARLLKQESLSGVSSGQLHHGMQEMVEQDGTCKQTSISPAIRAVAAMLLIVAVSLVALLYTEPGRVMSTWLAEKAGNYGIDLELPGLAPSEKPATHERGIFSGEGIRRTLEETEQERMGRSGVEDRGELGGYRYEIELHSGGWIHTDNLEIGPDTVTYTSQGGLEMAIERREVKAVKRIPVK